MPCQKVTAFTTLDGMAQTDGENIAAQQSSKSQKDFWDKADSISKWAAVIATGVIPIVIGVASYQIQKSIAKQSVAKDYVGIATTILERPSQEGDGDLREWARKLLVRYSPEPFSPKAQDQLQYGGLAELSGKTFGQVSLSPDLTKAAMTETTYTPDRPRSPKMSVFVVVYDLRTRRELSRYDAEGGNFPFDPSIIAWSSDSSKLLVCSQAVGRVIAFDLTQGKRIGVYQSEFPPASNMESFNFSEDNRSVTIKRADGRTDVWQLPEEKAWRELNQLPPGS